MVEWLALEVCIELTAVQRSEATTRVVAVSAAVVPPAVLGFVKVVFPGLTETESFGLDSTIELTFAFVESLSVAYVDIQLPDAYKNIKNKNKSFEKIMI